MRAGTFIAAAAAAIFAHGPVAAQQSQPDSTPHRVVTRPPRPATVYLGLGWSYRLGEPFVVTRVDDDSPASRAGLVTGDRILAVDGVDTVESGVLFAGPTPGRHYRLRVQRGDQELELELIAAPPRPAAPR
ncbi:MAG: PDZ domain-containing protein [Longimicrobiaceae bacterium]